MSFARARAIRGLQTAFRSTAVPRVSAPARTALQAGRRYASGGGHGHAEPSSDLPWLIGGIVVTVPSCWYLWPSGSDHAEHAEHADHGSHDSHEEEPHDEPAEASKEEPAESEEPEQKEKPKQEESADSAPTDEKKDDEDKGEKEESSGDDKEDKDAQQTATDDSEKQAEAKKSDAAQQSKGKVKEDSAANTEIRKTENSEKGGTKKRIDSGLQKDLGAQGESQDEKGDDKPAPAKPAQKQGDDPGDMTTKQRGLSNTPTRHSTKVDEDPEKSKKPEGGPDTAKVMGTVDPNRPAR